MTSAGGEGDIFLRVTKNGTNFLSDPILFSNYAGWIPDKLFYNKGGLWDL